MVASLKLLEAISDKTIDKKTYILATFSSKLSILLVDPLSSQSIGDAAVTYDVMKIALLNHFKVNVFRLRSGPFSKQQQQTPSETSSEFYFRRKKQSGHCNFGSHLNKTLRDIMVWDVRA